MQVRWVVCTRDKYIQPRAQPPCSEQNSCGWTCCFHAKTATSRRLLRMPQETSSQCYISRLSEVSEELFSRISIAMLQQILWIHARVTFGNQISDVYACWRSQKTMMPGLLVVTLALIFADPIHTQHRPPCSDSLDKLMGESGHPQTHLHSVLFDDQRSTLLNVVLLGATDNALAAWRAYFCNAVVQKANATNLTLASGTIDVAVDGLGHNSRQVREQTLHHWWPFLKNDGYYIMESLDPSNGGSAFQTAPEALKPETQSLLMANSVFFADTSLGQSRVCSEVDEHA